jgi:hypothetical protein
MPSILLYLLLNHGLTRLISSPNGKPICVSHRTPVTASTKTKADSNICNICWYELTTIRGRSDHRVVECAPNLTQLVHPWDILVWPSNPL